MPTLTVPDAVHLATAIIQGVDELHTYDQNDVKHKDATKKRPAKRGLIPLSGNVAGYDLVICKPSSAQLSLLPHENEDVE